MKKPRKPTKPVKPELDLEYHSSTNIDLDDGPYSLADLEDLVVQEGYDLASVKLVVDVPYEDYPYLFASTGFTLTEDHPEYAFRLKEHHKRLRAYEKRLEKYDEQLALYEKRLAAWKAHREAVQVAELKRMARRHGLEVVAIHGQTKEAAQANGTETAGR